MKHTKKRGRTKRHKRFTRHKRNIGHVNNKYMVYKNNRILVCMSVPANMKSQRRNYIGGGPSNKDVDFMVRVIFDDIAGMLNRIETDRNARGDDIIRLATELGIDVDSLNAEEASTNRIDNTVDTMDSYSSLSSDEIDEIKSRFKHSWNDYELFQILLTDLTNASDPKKKEIATYVLETAYGDYDKYKDIIEGIIHKDTSGFGPNERTQVYEILKYRAKLVDFITSIRTNIADLNLDEKTKEDIITSIQRKTKLSTSSMSSNAMSLIKNSSIALGQFLSPSFDVNKGEEGEHNETKVEFLWYPRSSKRSKNGAKLAKDKYGQFVVVVNPAKYSHYFNWIGDIINGVEDGIEQTVNECKGKYCEEGTVGPTPLRKKVYTVKRTKLQPKAPGVDEGVADASSSSSYSSPRGTSSSSYSSPRGSSSSSSSGSSS